MTTADVIVVGGGILGTSAALHLRRAGVGVTVLEANQIASGTTSAGGGFVAMWASGAFPDWDEPELECERYALSFYRDLAAEGADLDLHNNASLWLALTETGWHNHLRPIAEHPAPLKREVLEPAQIGEVTHGMVNPFGVHSGVLQPDSLHISAPKAAKALESRCREEGVVLQENCSVTSIRVDKDRVQGVVTNEGFLSAETVVVAAGAWSASLLKSVGYEAPMVPLTASRLISPPAGVPHDLPMLMVEELSFLWARGHHGRLLWGIEYEVAPRYDYVSADLPDDVKNIAQQQAVEQTLIVSRRAADAIPLLARVEPAEVAHGLPCYTKDLRALVGQVPGVDGLFLVSGDNQAGVTHGPGYGRLVADLVTADAQRGEPAVEAFRLDRFADVTAQNIADDARDHIFALTEAERGNHRRDRTQ